MPKLTKRIVDAAEPREAPFFIWCSDLKGFGVRVWPAGKRVYVVDYRTRDGTRRRMTIGAHGALTTEEARRQAVVVLGDAIRGEDPVLDRSTRRNALTVAELCDAYMQGTDEGLIFGRKGKAKKQSTLRTDRTCMERHIKPLLGRKIVRDLTPADITRFIRDVTTGKTARVEVTGKPGGKSIVTGGAGTATRTAAVLGAVLSYAMAEGIIETNPVNRVQKPASKIRDRRLTPEEYRALGDYLRKAEAEGMSWWATGPVWLLALTGCRRSEIVGLRWSEVDTAGRVLRLADSKTGASLRPLGNRALEILGSLPREPGAPFVFPATRSGRDPESQKPFGGMQGAWERIREKAGLPGDVLLHTLRHSFASVASDLGLADSTIGAMLGHSSGTITSRYVHRLDALLVATTDRVVTEIWRQMTGEEPPAGGEPSL